MSEDIAKWIIGVLAAIGTLIGGVITRDRQLMRQIREGDEKLHDRINRVKDESAKKSDVDRHVDRFDQGLQALREEVRSHGIQTTQRLDTIIDKVSSQRD